MEVHFKSLTGESVFGVDSFTIHKKTPMRDKMAKRKSKAKKKTKITKKKRRTARRKKKEVKGPMYGSTRPMPESYEAVPESRTFDGSNNNKDNPTWGKAGEPLLRNTSVGYTDGISKFRKTPNPRAISNKVCKGEDPPRPPHKKLSNYMWAWGQYLDHEIDLSLEQDEHSGEPLVSTVPDKPNVKIESRRSQFDPRTGTDKKNPRQQTNVLSAYVDAANVYGASCARAVKLRELDGSGRMKVTNSKHGPLLPFNTMRLANATGPRFNSEPIESFFVAGDVRSNEHNVLTCMHTLFVREHNSLCDSLVKKPSAVLKKAIKALGRDEAIFQQARRIVSALEQVITYEEFLPALLGRGAIPKYKKYDPKVNATIANVFSTAAYRLGHDMLNETILLAPPGDVSATRPLELEKAFWNPAQVKRLGIDVFLNGLAKQNMESIDAQTVEAIRSRLFNVHANEPNKLLDLAALNIMRGRDHGLPDYNQCRVDYGLKKKTSFGQITDDPEIQSRLKKAYGSVNDIDPWVGGLAEKPHRKAIIGEFFYTVVRDQFIRLRDGDRFWYEHDPAFSKAEVAQLRKTRLSDVIKRNTNIKRLQKNVFFT